MSIGKRLLDLARANLTDFRAAFDADHLRELLSRREEEVAGDKDDGNGGDKDDKKKRREGDKGKDEGDDEGDDADESVGTRAGRAARGVRDAASEAWERAYEQARARAGVRGEPLTDPAGDRRRWYKTLELQPGADLKEVRRAYRRLLLRYHPDKFANDPEKAKVATEVTRKLTEAYNGLQRYLGG